MAADPADDRAIRRSARAVLLVGILAGITSGASTVVLNPEQVSLAADVYFYAAQALLAGEDIYAVTPPDLPGYYYLYPPIVTVVFVPHALLGSPLVSFAIQTLLNVAAGVGTAVVLWRALRRRGVELSRFDRALLVAFVLVSTYGVIQVINGQVTLWLGFALAVGFDALDGRRENLAGVAFAAAAIVKLFPAAVGLWLIRRRAWRAITVAIATGCGAMAIGVLAFGPDLTITYATEVLVGRMESQSFYEPPDPGRNAGGIRRQLVGLAGVDAAYHTPLAFAILAPVVALLYRRVETDERRQTAILGTIVATLLFLPLQALYFPLIVYPLVVLLYRLPSGGARRALLAGTLLTYAVGGYETTTFLLDVLPLPHSIADGVLGVADAVFTVIQPTTAGMWLLLGACLLVHYRREPIPQSVPSPAE